jgi:hypothetical protein
MKAYVVPSSLLSVILTNIDQNHASLEKHPTHSHIYIYMFLYMILDIYIYIRYIQNNSYEKHVCR